MMRIWHLSCVLVLTVLFAFAIGGAAFAAGERPGGPAPSVAENVLYNFCSQTNCADGAAPYAGLIRDGEGNFYGTTLKGGSHGHGTVYKLAPDGGGWRETVLYNFCSESNCSDGASPYAGLVMDPAGNLYGTTGSDDGGTVFKLAPSATGWTEAVLYHFCGGGSDCPGGGRPGGGLIIDQAGNLYGTTNDGGAFKYGVVFKLTPGSSSWTETILYTFCSQSNCTDGGFPGYAGVIMDGAGNLYGTTDVGGNNGYGTVYKLAPGSMGWTETVIYSFCSQPNCTDGAGPNYGDLIIDRAGNLYGTTFVGGGNGTDICDPSGCGTGFKLVPGTTGWTETVLYRFCSESDCRDGGYPAAGLIIDRAGTLYGTPVLDGLANSSGYHDGTVFQLVPDGSGWTHTILDRFDCSPDKNCPNGASPFGGLIIDRAGNLYGTAAGGGNACALDAFGCGVVFRISSGNYTLSVTKAGKGTVTSTPTGIDCGLACDANFSSGTEVTLTASPASGASFAGWGGVCSGTGNCTVTMTADQSVSATFTGGNYNLSVSTAGSPGGS